MTWRTVSTLSIILTLGCTTGGGRGGSSSAKDTAAAPLAADTAAAGAGTDAPTASPPAGVPSYDDDAAIIAWSEEALAACPPVSRSTVPGGWNAVMVGQTGCMVSLPPSWTSEGDAVSLEASLDDAGSVGYLTINTFVDGAAWTEVTLAEQLVSEMQVEHPTLTVIKADTYDDPYGLGIKIRILGVKLKIAGVPTVGSIKVVFSGCSPLVGNCALNGTATWTPLADLPKYGCTLAQIDASLKCPGGASTCGEAECDAGCKGKGRESGSCVGDSCVCSG